MQIIQRDDFTFHADIEKTKAYYCSKQTLCNCCGCRNLYAQIDMLSKSLTAFLSEFGVDICRPDECAWIEMDNYLDYLFVGYTVTGFIETEGICQTDIGGFHVQISRGDTATDWFPNQQTEPCFFVSVTGISLPWVLDEPFPREERFSDKIKSLFKKDK